MLRILHCLPTFPPFIFYVLIKIGPFVLVLIQKHIVYENKRSLLCVSIMTFVLNRCVHICSIDMTCCRVQQRGLDNQTELGVTSVLPHLLLGNLGQVLISFCFNFSLKEVQASINSTCRVGRNKWKTYFKAPSPSLAHSKPSTRVRNHHYLLLTLTSVMVWV